MVRVIGFDIGGANTKAAFATTNNGVVDSLEVASVYFPVWKYSEKLSTVLKRLRKKVSGSSNLDLVVLTITAELSDSFNTKRNGVDYIIMQAKNAFPDIRMLILDVDSRLRTVEEARAEPLKVAASNWAATGWLISHFKQNCIVIDVGSTTTSIIPILNGTVVAEGKTDLEKLICGELVYTGSLRTNVAAIVNAVPVRGCFSRVSSELFAQSADVHLMLGNISESDYTVETADGKAKTRQAALARLARIVCADTEMLNDQEIVQMAQYVYEKQVENITSGFKQVCNRLQRKPKDVVTVVTGLGRNFLARKAALQADCVEVVDFGELVGNDVASVSTAFAVALLGASYIEGRFLSWMG